MPISLNWTVERGTLVPPARLRARVDDPERELVADQDVGLAVVERA